MCVGYFVIIATVVLLVEALLLLLRVFSQCAVLGHIKIVIHRACGAHASCRERRGRQHQRKELGTRQDVQGLSTQVFQHR